MTTTFDRFASKTATTNRALVSGGKKGTPTANLTGIKCTPVYPASTDTLTRLQISTPHDLVETFVEGVVDIVRGDEMVIDGVTYPVRDVDVWPYQSSQFMHVVLEQLRK